MRFIAYVHFRWHQNIFIQVTLKDEVWVTEIRKFSEISPVLLWCIAAELHEILFAVGDNMMCDPFSNMDQF